MKVMFLDESGDHSLTKLDQQFPVFCLAGCIFDELDYSQNAKAKIDALKISYFHTSNIILHSREIRKCEAPFNILQNTTTRNQFYIDFNNLISDLSFTILAAVIRKNELKAQYTDPANPYELSLRFIMERFLYFLETHNDVGYISVESRDPKSNTDLLNTFTHIMNNGSHGGGFSITSERFQARISKMIFITKQQNENGHQIADMVAYPIAKFGLKPDTPNPSFDVIKPKFRHKGNKILGYGLKIFPY